MGELRFGELGKRVKHLRGLFLGGEKPLGLQVEADLLGHGLAFGPGCADREARFFVLAGIEVSLSHAVISFFAAEFMHPSELVQGAESFGGLAVFERVNRRLVTGVGLPPNGGKFGTGEVAMAFENPQRVACLNPFVLASVADQ